MKPGRASAAVILTCFNHEATIAEAVESVLAQTAAPASVTVVDDGSRDRSVEVLRGFEPRVRVIAQANAGVCAARNRGAADIDAEFLMFLDGDDALRPTYLERTLDALRLRPRASFAYTPFEWFGARTGLQAALPWRRDLLPMGNWIANAALMRTEALRAVGGFDLRWNRRGWEDWDLFLKFADHGLQGVLVDEPLLRVRSHSSNQRNRGAEADRLLERDILSAHRGLLPTTELGWWFGKLVRRAWLSAKACNRIAARG